MEEGEYMTRDNLNRMNRRQLGTAGEAAAERYLQGLGMRLLARNWRCRSGEIDLIFLDGELVVFVEVRTRTSARTFGTAAESIDARKQRQVMATSQVYLMQQRLMDRQVRFDVVSAEAEGDGTILHLDHIRSAF
ncbi:MULTISPECIES: YraN family protein [Paenibacillus]|uniref:YraN family protein n=1 Tax=Paenibacillus TaxID=44249 RepID=UPI0022B8BC02|nr:YraN family protein [Paenibacillus caseinilyticus]MCZ8520072.1 YraN family protein [Paenibacillus caseinilyticus]